MHPKYFQPCRSPDRKTGPPFLLGGLLVSGTAGEPAAPAATLPRRPAPANAPTAPGMTPQSGPECWVHHAQYCPGHRNGCRRAEVAAEHPHFLVGSGGDLPQIVSESVGSVLPTAQCLDCHFGQCSMQRHGPPRGKVGSGRPAASPAVGLVGCQCRWWRLVLVGVVVMHGIVRSCGAGAVFGRWEPRSAADSRGWGAAGAWPGVELRRGSGGCIVF
jgi:hypothetical protein